MIGDQALLRRIFDIREGVAFGEAILIMNWGCCNKLRVRLYKYEDSMLYQRQVCIGSFVNG